MKREEEREREREGIVVLNSSSFFLSQFAAPNEFCRECFNEYQAYRAEYDQLPSSCQSFGAFKLLHDSFTDLWAENCPSCEPSALATYALLVNEVFCCINSSSSLCNSGNSSSSSGALEHGNQEVCVRCLANLTAVDNYRSRLNKTCIESADVIDLYRRLVYQWTENKCLIYHVTKRLVYLVLSIVFGPSQGRKRPKKKTKKRSMVKHSKTLSFFLSFFSFPFFLRP